MNDRDMHPCSLSGRLPLARGETGGEDITQLNVDTLQDVGYRERDRGLRSSDPTLCGNRNFKVVISECYYQESQGSISDISSHPREILECDWWCRWYPPYGKAPTGFSEPDVGKPPYAECDIGDTMDNPWTWSDPSRWMPYYGIHMI